MRKMIRGTRRNPTQSAPVFYLVTLLYMLVMSLVYCASFAPLLALFLFEKGSSLRYLALLCPVLVVFFALPLRFSFAQAMADRYHGEAFTLGAAFSPSLYGEKVAEGLLFALHAIKWAIPLAAACAVLYYLYNNTEAFTLIKGITDFGAVITTLWNGFLNFFAGIFGGAKSITEGGIVEGLFAVCSIVGACLLFLCWGIVRNSAYRYIWAEATELDKNPRVEARRSLRGRRLQQLGVALINCVLLLPVLIALYMLIEPKQTIELLATQYADALVSQTALPAVALPYGKLAFVFFVCFLPLLPLRRMTTAYFATARIRKQMQISEFDQTLDYVPDQASLLYEDKPAPPTGRKQ